MKIKFSTELHTKVNSDVLKNHPPTFNSFLKNNGSFFTGSTLAKNFSLASSRTIASLKNFGIWGCSKEWIQDWNKFYIHYLPLGLKSFAKPDIALQNNVKGCIDWFNNWIYRRNFLRCFSK